MYAKGADMIAAYERAAHHAERAGARGALADALGWLALAAWLGMMRPEDTIRHARALGSACRTAARSRRWRRSPRGTAWRCSAGSQRAVQRTCVDTVLEELGLRLKAAGTQQSAGRIEMLADDLLSAERELDGVRGAGVDG